MRFFFTLILSTTILFAAAEVVELDDKYKKSINCKGCHNHLVKEWEKSWHAKSHYNNDEYLRATIDYISRKTRKSLNSVKIKCAHCHNPRISVTDSGIDYEIMSAMELDDGSDVNKAVESDVIEEGINCVICHNIDIIHSDKDDTQRGINRVKWTPSGTMSGPFNDSVSPYHKTQYRDFMDTNPNQLCFVCHANDRTVNGLVFTDMKSEYKSGKKLCVDCHMGARRDGVASTYSSLDEEPKKREIRSHTFAGAHMEHMLKDSLSLELKQSKEDLIITIVNPQPHNIPSGFGSRELVLDVSCKSDTTLKSSRSISLTRHYTSRRNKPTIPHLAVKMSKDMSIPAQGKKAIKIGIPYGFKDVEVKLSYRLVNDEVRSILKLKDEIWSRKSFITSKSLKLK